MSNFLRRYTVRRVTLYVPLQERILSRYRGIKNLSISGIKLICKEIRYLTGNLHCRPIADCFNCKTNFFFLCNIWDMRSNFDDVTVTWATLIRNWFH